MPLYTEPVIREPNHRGKLRLTTVLGHLKGAVGRGFDGDGVPSKRGKETNGRRIWFFDTPLDELPNGVKEITRVQYTAIDVIREATKPIPLVDIPIEQPNAIALLDFDNTPTEIIPAQLKDITITGAMISTHRNIGPNGATIDIYHTTPSDSFIRLVDVGRNVAISSPPIEEVIPAGNAVMGITSDDDVTVQLFYKVGG